MTGSSNLLTTRSAEDDMVSFHARSSTGRGTTPISPPDESLRINVPETAKDHVRRDTYTDTLHDELRSRPVVLVGDECIGKTMLAADYVAKFKMRTHDVIWINANGQPWLEQQFYEITRDPQWSKWVSSNPPPYVEQQQPVNNTGSNDNKDVKETKTSQTTGTQNGRSAIVDYVYRALSARGSFIVVIDDAVPYKLLNYLPPTDMASNVRVLITSRLPGSEWRGFNTMTVQELLKTEQPRLLADTPSTQQPSIRQSSVPTLNPHREAICTALAGQPLLLAMAKGYIKTGPDREKQFANALKLAAESKQDVAVLCCETVVAAAAQDPNAAKILTLSSLIAPNHIPESLLEAVVPEKKERDKAIKLLEDLHLLRAEHKETTENKVENKTENKIENKEQKTEKLPQHWYTIPRTIQTAVIFKTNQEQRLLLACLNAVNILENQLPDDPNEKKSSEQKPNEGKSTEQKLNEKKASEKKPEDYLSLLQHGYCLLALAINLKVIDAKTLAPLAKKLVPLAQLVGDTDKVDAINNFIKRGEPIKLSMPDKFEWDSPFFAPASNIFPSNFNVDVFQRLFINPMEAEIEKQKKADAEAKKNKNIAAAQESKPQKNQSTAGKDVKDIKEIKKVEENKTPQAVAGVTGEKKVPQTIADVEDKIEPFFITDYCPLPVPPKAFQLFVDLIRAWLHGQFCALSGEQKTNEIKRRRDEFSKEFTQSSLHHSFSATSHAHAYLIRVIGKIASYFTTYWRRDPQFADGALQLLDFMHAFGAAGQRMFQAFARHELGDKPVVFRFERLYGPVEYVVYPRLQTSANPQPVVQPANTSQTNTGSQPAARTDFILSLSSDLFAKVTTSGSKILTDAEMKTREEALAQLKPDYLYVEMTSEGIFRICCRDSKLDLHTWSLKQEMLANTFGDEIAKYLIPKVDLKALNNQKSFDIIMSKLFKQPQQEAYNNKLAASMEAVEKKGSFAKSSKNIEWVYANSEWRAKKGPAFGGDRMNDEFLAWAQQEGRNNWFNLTSNTKLTPFLNEIFPKLSPKEMTEMTGYFKNVEIESLPEFHAMLNYEDTRNSTTGFFQENMTIASDVLWFAIHKNKQQNSVQLEEKTDLETQVEQYREGKITVDEFVNIALTFLHSDAYQKQDLNYTRDLTNRHLYRLFDLITNFGDAMDHTQFATAIGYLMTPNTVDNSYAQVPRNLGRAIDFQFQAVYHEFQMKNEKKNESPALEQKEIKQGDQVSKPSQAGTFSGNQFVEVKFCGARSISETKTALRAKNGHCHLHLCGPEVKMVAGRLSGNGMNLVMSLPDHVEPASNHMMMMYDAPTLNGTQPTMFLSLACHERSSLSFVQKEATWLHDKERMEGVAGTAAPLNKRYFRRTAVGQPQAIESRVALMRKYPTELIPPHEFRNLTAPQASIFQRLTAG